MSIEIDINNFRRSFPNYTVLCVETEVDWHSGQALIYGCTAADQEISASAFSQLAMQEFRNSIVQGLAGRSHVIIINCDKEEIVSGSEGDSVQDLAEKIGYRIRTLTPHQTISSVIDEMIPAPTPFQINQWANCSLL
jgi:hypothetical protein